MDRANNSRRVGNRNRTNGGGASKTGVRGRRTGRRTALNNRRNRRVGIRRNRDRLARAQNNIGSNRRAPPRRFRRFNYFYGRRNLRLRIVFVGGLPPDVGSRRLRTLFRSEGPIRASKIVFDRMGYSKGYGFLEFVNPRDAFRAIRKWNNTSLGGRTITVEYRKRRRINRRFGGNNYGYRNGYGFNNFGRYNQQRQGYGYGNRNAGGRGGFRGGFRQGARF